MDRVNKSSGYRAQVRRRHCGAASLPTDLRYQAIRPVRDPVISIVVCTFNRAPALRKMLDSFFRQNEIEHIRHEVLIIDNNSDDETPFVVQDLVKKGKVRYFLEPNQGLSFARNRGIAESRGDFISFLDDDVIVQENWLSCLKASFEQTGADVIGGRVSLRFEVPPAKWLGVLFRKCLSEVDLGASRKSLSDGDCLYGANLSFRKDVFTSVGAFDIDAGRRQYELLSGEETLLLRRVIAERGKVFYDPDVRVEHLIGTERLQWRYFVKRADGDGLTQERLDTATSVGRQFLRVGRASIMLLKAWFRRYSVTFRAEDDSYEHKLAEFVFLRQRRYTQARMVRFMRQLRESYRRQPPKYRGIPSQRQNRRSACN